MPCPTKTKGASTDTCRSDDARADGGVGSHDERRGAVSDSQRNLRRAVDNRAAERHSDEPAAACSTGHQAELAEFAGDIVGGDLVTGRTRIAALQKVAGKELHVCVDALGRE